MPRRRPSRLAETDEKISQLLESIPEFDSVFERKTPVEVQTMLDEFLLDESDAEEVSSESTRYESSAPTSAVDKAFEELLGS